MSANQIVGRLEVLKTIRQHQMQWLESLQGSVAGGEKFAICASDEFEELFALFGIHTLVVNYWHGIVANSRNGAHFAQLLRDRGYTPSGLGPLAYASSLDPEKAPWGGLPCPTIMLGSTRDEAELRFMELWAKEFGCPYYPMDYNLAAPWKCPPPDGWWKRIRGDWASLIDSHQLDLRVMQMQALIAHLVTITGRNITIDSLSDSLHLLNRQIDLWARTLDIIAAAPVCPVTLRDQIAMYQAMWHRGTQQGIDFIETYHEEIVERVRLGQQAYEKEDYRLLFWSGANEPPYHAYLQEQHGAVFVGNLYTASVPLYARDFEEHDPLRALASRNMFLIAYEQPGWLLELAANLRCDGVIACEGTFPEPTPDSKALAEAGIPYLNLPNFSDSPEQRERLDGFISEIAVSDRYLARRGQ